MADDDNALLRRIQESDHAAFACLVERYTGRFYRFAWRIVGNETEAEDVVQDAFLKLWEKPQIWDERRNVAFTTWFTRIIYNRCIDTIRKRRRHVSDGDGLLTQFENQEAGPEEKLVENQVQNFLEKGIHSLPERQKLALTLCCYEGYTNREAAEIMGVKVKALESLLMRAKAHLKTVFLERGLLMEKME